MGQKIGPIIIILIIIVIFLLQIVPEKFLERIGELADIKSAASWQARLIRWKPHFEAWKESPIIGWGPAKATMETIVDNEWLLILRRYGILGCVVLFSLGASFYRGLSKILLYSQVKEAKCIAIALQATLLSYLVYMIPLSVYHSLQIMPILLVFMGIAYSQC